MNRMFEAVIFFLSGFVPRCSKKLVFGAWLGKQFSDNPKYLILFLAARQNELDLVWIGEDSVRASIPVQLPVRFVCRGSLKAIWELLTAGACFVTHGYKDLALVNLMRGARRVYLGHGLAIKHMGSRDNMLGNPILTALRRLFQNVYAFDFYIASSGAHRDKLLVEYATWTILPEQVMECGQPRVDFLLKNSKSERVIANRRQLLGSVGVSSAKTVITYLPTFRKKGAPVFSFAALEPARRERLETVLKRCDAVILEKSHFADTLRGGVGGAAKSDRVFRLGGGVRVDTQELLLATDLLITDYSGCYVDFLVLQRPILHFAYDRIQYENADRGLYFNLDEVAGGPIVACVDELCGKIEESLLNPGAARVAQDRMRLKLVEYERGSACQQIARTVLSLDLVQTLSEVEAGTPASI